MDFAVGNILTGKVTGITKFGAFVAIAPGKSGLVHISEIADSYVSDVNQFLKEGQEVKVKIINIDENGRINLSIRKAVEPSQQAPRPGQQRPYQQRPYQQRPYQRKPYPSSRPQDGEYSHSSAPAAPREPGKDSSFEDKLKQFMQDSDSKISSLYADRKTSRRRGKN